MPPPPVAQLFTAAHQSLGQGQLARAETFAQQVLERQPRHAGALSILGVIAQRRSDPDGAIAWLRKAVKADGRNPGLHCMLAESLVIRDRTDQAMASYDRALALAPGLPDAVAGRAEILARQGRADDAQALLEPLARGANPAPKVVEQFTALLVRRGEYQAALDFADPLLERPDLQEPRKRALLFLVGDARDRLGDPDGAFAAYTRANAVGERPFDAAGTERQFDALRAFFGRVSAADLPRAPAAPDWPVYIVGLPRCGSTLIEQILHAHPDVEGTGEIPLVGNAIQHLLGDAAPRYPAVLAELAPDRVAAEARAYLARFRALGPDPDRLVDKNLGNFKHLGPLAMLVPGARVIHARRDPMDHCLSCFINNLSPVTHRYASTLERMGRYFRAYTALMDFWRETLDLRMLDVAYEDLVAEPETVSRRIVDFLGLEWNDACLRFHTVERAVSTLSTDQVKQPMYTRAVKRWQRYEKHLGGLKAALAG